MRHPDAERRACYTQGSIPSSGAMPISADYTITNIQMTKQEAIQAVQTSISSIFTREDVVAIISQIADAPTANAPLDLAGILTRVRGALVVDCDNYNDDLSEDDVEYSTFGVRHDNEIYLTSVSFTTDSIVTLINNVIQEVWENIETEFEKMMDESENKNQD